MAITASKLYDFLQCPHRVWRDEWGPQDEKDREPNPFVQLLWDRGLAYEKERLAIAGPVVNIAELPYDERPRATLDALRSGVPLIYQGMLVVDELVGIPDFLRREPDGSYIPIDVKSGVGVEGVALDADDGDDGKPKKHYAIQLALYVDALQRLGFEARRSGIILDIRGTEVRYDLNAPQGARTPETYWQLYVRSRQAVAELLSGKDKNDPAISGVCGLCPWYESCRRWAAQVDDLTGLFYVGRKVRDSLVHDTGAQTIAALCSLDLPEVLRRRETEKGFLKGIGEKTLQKTVTRARVMRIERKPVLY
jgi:predicted RecB family nuclease